jgi:hypothetical protein
MKKAHEQVTTGSPGTPGFPCAMVLTVSFVLSPVTGLFCHRRLRVTTCKLDASVGASGPHDFAVRVSAARLASPKRPSHPAPNVRDDRDTPLLWGAGQHRSIPVSTKSGSGIFLQVGLDHPNQIESLQQIAVYAHAISEAFWA